MLAVLVGIGTQRTHICTVKSPAQKRARSVLATPDLFGVAQVPAGFAYAPDVLSQTDEQSLVEQFTTLPFKPFEFHGYLGNRRIVSFGHKYDYSAHTLRKSDAMPVFLEPLKDVASQFTGIPVDAFEQALVTEYAPGAGIGWHRDTPMFQDVVAFSFLAPCTLRLRRALDNGWDRRNLEIAPRSAYRLSGSVRDDWYHSIAPMDVLRYSVTLRTFRPDGRNLHLTFRRSARHAWV